MLSVAGHKNAGSLRGAAERRWGPGRAALRALLRSFHRWWAKQCYRPERRYMRG